MKWTDKTDLNDYINASIPARGCLAQACRRKATCVGKPREGSGKLAFRCSKGHTHYVHWKEATDLRNQKTKIMRLEERFGRAKSDEADPSLILDEAERAMQQQKAVEILRGA